MDFKSTFLFLLVFFSLVVSSAQEASQKFLGIEAGMTMIAGNLTHDEYIRGDIPTYTTDNSSSKLACMMTRYYFGIKPEVLLLNDRVGIAIGLRYTQTSSSAWKSDYMSNKADFFYVLYRQDGLNTEYLKVKEIIQKSGCIGIPVEVRYFPMIPAFSRLYIKLGSEMGFRLQTHTDVVFYDNAMDLYKEDIVAKVGKPGSFYSSVYGAAGFKLGKKSKSSFSIELSLPFVFLTKETSGLLNPIAGGGFQLNFQVPGKSKAQ